MLILHLVLIYHRQHHTATAPLRFPIPISIREDQKKMPHLPSTAPQHTTFVTEVILKNIFVHLPSLTCKMSTVVNFHSEDTEDEVFYF